MSIFFIFSIPTLILRAQAHGQGGGTALVMDKQMGDADPRFETTPSPEIYAETLAKNMETQISNYVKNKQWPSLTKKFSENFKFTYCFDVHGFNREGYINELGKHSTYNVTASFTDANMIGSNEAYYVILSVKGYYNYDTNTTVKWFKNTGWVITNIQAIECNLKKRK